MPLCDDLRGFSDVWKAWSGRCVSLHYGVAARRTFTLTLRWHGVTEELRFVLDLVVILAAICLRMVYMI